MHAGHAAHVLHDKSPEVDPEALQDPDSGGSQLQQEAAPLLGTPLFLMQSAYSNTLETFYLKASKQQLYAYENLNNNF